MSPVSAVEVHIQSPRSVESRPALDKPLLAIQIGSIVASYVIFVALLLALVLFVGRRLRRTVQSSQYALQMEMLKPIRPPESIDPSPVTPITQNLPSPTRSNPFNSWGSFPKPARRSQPSVNGSMVTVDESVVASDRQRAEDEMERLYAAVMEHDAQKAAGVNVASVKDSDSLTQSPDSQYTNPFTDRAASQVSISVPAVPPKSPRHSNRLSKLFSSKSATASNLDAGKLKSPKFPIRKSIPQCLHDSILRAPPPTAPQPPQAVPTIGPVLAPATRARPPAPLSLATSAQSPSSSSSLPFRQAYPQQSAPATKTTFLERPAKKNGPITGMPTPYSPYMPFTPVTPFTPGRTVNRRQRKREERGTNLRALNEDDLVKDEGDMWG
ncbi:hypothetical protein N7490_001527 [Penicillium lividum]|nr:hypothetical protein N7490_001527 [Penicillium lividum]